MNRLVAPLLAVFLLTAALPGTAGAVIITTLPDHTIPFFDFEPPDQRALPELVVSEAEAGAITGLDASLWATTGDHGILNSQNAQVRFESSEGRIDEVIIDVVALPGAGPIELLGIRGGRVLASDWTTGRVGDSGLVEGRLYVFHEGAFDTVVLQPGSCGSPLDPCVGRTNTFFADSLTFEVPEPAAALLGLFAALGLALRPRG
ncbi:MAG: hypothetical protein QNK05_17540 [Myxococcota bacterium]|nr:hypothetical protein [Myxococcota bacterium]